MYYAVFYTDSLGTKKGRYNQGATHHSRPLWAIHTSRW